MMTESATVGKPSRLATRMLRTNDRPTNDTRRPTGGIDDCCTRSTLYETRNCIRPSAPRMRPVARWAHFAFLRPDTGDLGVRRVAQQQVHAVARAATCPVISGTAARVAIVELMSPVCRMVPAGTAMANASEGMVDGEVLPRTQTRRAGLCPCDLLPDEHQAVYPHDISLQPEP